ncbi:unnamed protein product [Bursaphelenchus okinawaensis]|uniref:BTB domain-containing protein n=1 Tax=Bursaphelenchus okinawaensis TaxID=465554 RepID=A0A811LD20_9BILA|nr:unnamed protein product [Bursaphelenchus okinawaensis]CAG9121675.1 unnamed protein product [Bursaphelenchus okinawaensis]
MASILSVLPERIHFKFGSEQRDVLITNNSQRTIRCYVYFTSDACIAPNVKEEIIINIGCTHRLVVKLNKYPVNSKLYIRYTTTDKKVFGMEEVVIYSKYDELHVCQTKEYVVDTSRFINKDPYTDFLIVCEGGELNVSKLKLASSSFFFEILFRTNYFWRENTTGEIVLPYDYQNMKALIEFTYGNRRPFHGREAMSIIHIAKYFDMNPLVDFCIPYIVAFINTETIDEIATVSHKYNIYELHHECVRFQQSLRL